MLANALTQQRKTTTALRNARRSSVFGNALGNAAVGGIQRWQANRAAERAGVQSGMPSLFDPDYKPDWLYADETGLPTTVGASNTNGPGASSAGALPVVRGERYANDPAYQYMPSQGGYVQTDALNKFTGQVHAWSNYYSQTYEVVPSIESYLAGSEGDLYAPYFAYNNEVAKPFTQFQKDFNSDPARVEAAMADYRAQLAVNAQLAELLSPSPEPFTDAGYHAFVREQNAADWLTTKQLFRGMFEGATNGLALFYQQGTDSHPRYVKDGVLVHKTASDYWQPFPDRPTSVGQAAGRIVGPFALGALPLGAASELSSLGRLGQGASVAKTQPAIRARVLANVAETRAGNASSNVDVFFAKSDQIASGYAADQWGRVALRKGDVIYALRPGESAYFTDFGTLQASRLDSAFLSQALQVRRHDIYGYRPDIGGFRVTQDIFVPGGRAIANPKFGPGYGSQLFIQNHGKYLEPMSTVGLRKP